MILTKAKCDQCGAETAELDGNVISKPHWQVDSGSYCKGYFQKTKKELTEGEQA